MTSLVEEGHRGSSPTADTCSTHLSPGLFQRHPQLALHPGRTRPCSEGSLCSSVPPALQRVKVMSLLDMSLQRLYLSCKPIACKPFRLQTPESTVCLLLHPVYLAEALAAETQSTP